MLTYEYECPACGRTFEWRQGITEAPLEKCPECQGPVHRLASGGTGFMLKGRDFGWGGRQGKPCSMEQGGGTCCGRAERCDRPPCGGD
jgi:putative FmdB family regulatory protein